MRYESPRVDTISVTDVLARIGPARALMYGPGGGGGVGGTSNLNGTRFGGGATDWTSD